MCGFKHQIYSLTRHSFDGCNSQKRGLSMAAQPLCAQAFWGQKHKNSPQKKPGWTESFDCVLMFFWHWHCSKHSMMLRRNARKALESQIANISARISSSCEKQSLWSIGFSGCRSFSACEEYNQNEDDILVPVSVENHEESTNIIFILFIFNHEHNTTENCLLDMCCMWCHVGTEKVRWCQWFGHSSVENK